MTRIVIKAPLGYNYGVEEAVFLRPIPTMPIVCLLAYLLHPPAIAPAHPGSAKTDPFPIRTAMTTPSPSAGAAALHAGNPPTAGPGQGSATPDERPGESPSDFDPLLLNIRMSPNALLPPPELVKHSWVLDGYRLGRLDANSPRAAIIDDDQHRRLLILSATDQGDIRLYRVADLPMDVGLKLSAIVKNAQTRDCPHQRRDTAGELGCLALSLLAALQE
jgi:hypothetical protein